MGKSLDKLKAQVDADWKGDPCRYGKIPGNILRHPDISDGTKLLYAQADLKTGDEPNFEIEDALAYCVAHDMRKAAKLRGEAKQ